MGVDSGLVLVGGYWQTKAGRPWHRVVYRRAYGPIPPGWDVHHIDGNKVNNDPDNLIAIPRKLHMEIHRTPRHGRPLPARAAIAEMLYWVMLPAASKRLTKRVKQKKKTTRHRSQRERRHDRRVAEKAFTQAAEVYGPHRVDRYEYRRPIIDAPPPAPIRPSPKVFEPKTIRLTML
jgi:hypothetical protein